MELIIYSKLTSWRKWFRPLHVCKRWNYMSDRNLVQMITKISINQRKLPIHLYANFCKIRRYSPGIIILCTVPDQVDRFDNSKWKCCILWRIISKKNSNCLSFKKCIWKKSSSDEKMNIKQSKKNEYSSIHSNWAFIYHKNNSWSLDKRKKCR